jgi:hypothetical protein
MSDDSAAGSSAGDFAAIGVEKGNETASRHPAGKRAAPKAEATA